jgi:voltage-gated potassium channel
MGASHQQPEVHDLGTVLPADLHERRAMIASSLLRILAITVGLLVLYAFVPLTDESGLGALVGLIAGLIAFVVLVGWQIRTILRAEHPVLRGIEVVAFALPLLIMVFAYAYVSLSQADPEAFTEELNRVGALYFTVSTFSTVGFGDISAVSDGARLAVTAQMLLDLALIAGVVRLVILLMRTGIRRRASGPEG